MSNSALVFSRAVDILIIFVSLTHIILINEIRRILVLKIDNKLFSSNSYKRILLLGIFIIVISLIGLVMDTISLQMNPNGLIQLSFTGVEYLGFKKYNSIFHFFLGLLVFSVGFIIKDGNKMQGELDLTV